MNDTKSAYLRRLAGKGGSAAAIILLVILVLCFWPCFGGGKTLLASAEDAPSILPGGAYLGTRSDSRVPRYADPGAASWQTEPWLGFIGDQYRARKIPLWDPYQAYGSPLAANMQSQPFYPLTAALSLWLTPRTYNFFILGRLFIAGICTYFFLRMFLSFTAAIAGGIATMLAGYYIIFISMPHLSVEVLIPAVFLAGEYFLWRKSLYAVIWLAITVALVFLGGMPESALLLLTFAAAYLLFRLVSDAGLRLAWKQLLGMLLAAGAAGIGLSSFLLVPFFEYMAHCSSPHTPSSMMGLAYDKLGIAALSYGFPLLFGPLYSSPVFAHEPLRGYTGVIPLVLALIAVASALGWRNGSNSILNVLTFFFGTSVIALVLKQFGFAGVNWVGKLPYFNLIEFNKYDAPVLAFSIAALSAIGIERLVRRQAGLLIQGISIGSLGLLIGIAFNLSRTAVEKLSSIHVPKGILRWEIMVPEILLLSLLLGTLADYLWKRRVNKSFLGLFVVVLLTIELSLNYIVPIYRVYGQLPSIRRNPYAGAPYIRFLQSKSKSNDRVFGRHWMLMPSWASVFGLNDIRDMDGLYYAKYFPFVRNFVPAWDHVPTDLVSCFLGNGVYDLDSPLEKRLLQLSSVKYLVTDEPFVVPNPRINEALLQNKGHWPPDVQSRTGRTDFIMNGVAREGLGEHPPFTRLPYKLKVDNRDAKFRFSYALDPAVFPVKIGDGVGFTIEVQTRTGRIEKLFSKYIDPKHNPEERRWMDGEVDLSRYYGQDITLLFSTDPGPRGDSSFDWAAWSDFRFEDEPPTPESDFTLVYNAEAKVYQYDNVLPRASIFYNAVTEKGDAAVLKELANPSLDVFRSVVLDASKLSPQQAALVQAVNNGNIQHVEPAEIRSYKADAVEIEAKLTRGGILVLNDSDYPGWRALIDGRPSEWFSANYMFRGVFLGPGTHTVKYEYRPASFYWGAGISLFTVALLAGCALLQWTGFERPTRAATFGQTGIDKDTARELLLSS